MLIKHFDILQAPGGFSWITRRAEDIAADLLRALTFNAVITIVWCDIKEHFRCRTNSKECAQSVWIYLNFQDPIKDGVEDHLASRDMIHPIAKPCHYYTHHFFGVGVCEHVLDTFKSCSGKRKHCFERKQYEIVNFFSLRQWPTFIAAVAHLHCGSGPPSLRQWPTYIAAVAHLHCGSGPPSLRQWPTFIAAVTHLHCGSGQPSLRQWPTFYLPSTQVSHVLSVTGVINAGDRLAIMTLKWSSCSVTVEGGTFIRKASW